MSFLRSQFTFFVAGVFVGLKIWDLLSRRWGKSMPPFLIRNVAWNYQCLLLKLGTVNPYLRKLSYEINGNHVMGELLTLSNKIHWEAWPLRTHLCITLTCPAQRHALWLSVVRATAIMTYHDISMTKTPKNPCCQPPLSGAPCHF